MSISFENFLSKINKKMGKLDDIVDNINKIYIGSKFDGQLNTIPWSSPSLPLPTENFPKLSELEKIQIYFKVKK